MAGRGTPATRRVAAVERAAAVLDTLAEGGVLGTNEIARRTAGNVAEPRRHHATGMADIGPADHAVAPQQRQRVVAERPFGFGRVGFEAIGPSPEMLKSPPVPDQWIERRQEANLSRRLFSVSDNGRVQVNNSINRVLGEIAGLEEIVEYPPR